MKKFALLAALLGIVSATDAGAQEQDARLAAFRSFAEQYRRDNTF